MALSERGRWNRASATGLQGVLLWSQTRWQPGAEVSGEDRAEWSAHANQPSLWPVGLGLPPGQRGECSSGGRTFQKEELVEVPGGSTLNG